MQTIKRIVLLPVRVVAFPFKLGIRLFRSARVRRGLAVAAPVAKLVGAWAMRQGRKRLVRKA